MAGGEPGLSGWESIQTKLKDLSRAIHLLPEEEKTRVLYGLEDLTTLVKGSLLKSSRNSEVDRESCLQTKGVVESDSKIEERVSNADISETSSSIQAVRRSRRQCHAKKDKDFIMVMPGSRNSIKVLKTNDTKSEEQAETKDIVEFPCDNVIIAPEILTNVVKVESESDAELDGPGSMKDLEEDNESTELTEICPDRQSESSSSNRLIEDVQTTGNSVVLGVDVYSQEPESRLYTEEQMETCIEETNLTWPGIAVKVEYSEPVMVEGEPESVKPIKKSKKERCLVCRRKFLDKDTLNEHMQAVHKIKIELKSTQKPPEEGNDQGLQGKRERTVVKEEMTSTTEEGIDRPDKKCKTETKDTEFSTVYNEEEQVDNGQMYQCELCGKKLSKLIGLKQHMSRYHLKDLPTECELCNKSYDNYKNLLSHRRIVHGGKRFFCDQCNYITKHSLDLKRHMIRCHGSKEDYPYECEKCHKRFITSTTLRKHSEVHEEFRPQLKCSYDDCKFVTHSTMSMTIHVRNKHLGKQRYFDCEICGKRLGSKATYDTHLRRHRGQYIYKCPKCSASFPCRTQLSAHTRVHGDKTEECPVCGKKFNAKAKVQRHMIIHTGEKKYSCPLCIYKCNLDSNLRKHCIARHNIEYPPKRKPVYQLHSADEGERLRQGGVEYVRSPSEKSTPLSQKIELMFQGAVNGQLDSEELLGVLQSHGFTGNETLQVEVGGQTYLINQGAHTTTTNTTTASPTNTGSWVIPNNENLMTDIEDHAKPVVAVQGEETLEDNIGESGQYQMTFSDTAVRLTGVSPDHGKKKDGFLKLQETDDHGCSSTSAGTGLIDGLVVEEDEEDEEADEEENSLSIVTPEYNVDINGECVLSEETLQQISSSVDETSTIIVIQKPDGIELKSTTRPIVTTTADTTTVPMSTVEYLSTNEKPTQFLSIGKHQEESFGLKSIDPVNHHHQTTVGSSDSVLDYGFVTQGAGDNTTTGGIAGKQGSWVSAGLEIVDQVISVSTDSNDQQTLVVVGGEQSVL